MTLLLSAEVCEATENLVESLTWLQSVTVQSLSVVVANLELHPVKMFLGKFTAVWVIIIMAFLWPSSLSKVILF